MSYWSDKTAVVTGGSAGLGQALVETLSAAGAQVAAVARGRERLQALCATDSKLATVFPVVADVTRQPEVDQAVCQIVERFGGIHVLVNCAGRSTRATILDTSPDDLQSMWEINLLATARMARACAPYLLDAGGHLVNVGSLASKIASPYLGAYPATKHALAAYTQQLRLELGPRGLHVLLVCPGPIARGNDDPRYANQSNVPPGARHAGGGARVKALDPYALANEILRACEKRKPELIRPRRARILFAAAALSPRLGDWLLRRFVTP